MAFHGAILALMSRGTDLQMFMRGARELKTASERAPDDLTVRIVLAFVTQVVPPEARSFLGASNPVENLQFIGKTFDNFSSDFAPHAGVVMNAFIGEGLLAAGRREEARASFEKALKEPEPFDAGQLAGRKLLNSVIEARMKGGENPIFSNPVFSGCNSCHLAAPDKLLNVK
jgi:hypothetical protein